MKKTLIILALFIQSSLSEPILPSNEAQNISIEKGQWQYFEITATSDDMSISLELSNLSSDIDLYIKRYSPPTLSHYDERGIQQGKRSEHLTPYLYRGEKLYIGIYGYTQATALLKAQYLKKKNTLHPNNPVNLTVNKREWKYYKIDSTQNNNKIKVTLNNLSDDLDLYISKTAYPTLDIYDTRSIQQATRTEQLNSILDNRESLYIGVYGYHNAEATITAQYLNQENMEVLAFAHRQCNNGVNDNKRLLCLNHSAYVITEKIGVVYNTYKHYKVFLDREEVSLLSQYKLEGHGFTTDAYFAQKIYNKPIYVVKTFQEGADNSGDYIFFKDVDKLLTIRWEELSTNINEGSIRVDSINNKQLLYFEEHVYALNKNYEYTYDISDVNNVTLVGRIEVN